MKNLTLYGITIPIDILSVVSIARENRSNLLTINGMAKKDLFQSVVWAMLAISENEECHDEDDCSCFCWSCRTGAGTPLSGENYVGYMTASMYRYILYNDGRFFAEVSERSLADGSEYAILN